LATLTEITLLTVSDQGHVQLVTEMLPLQTKWIHADILFPVIFDLLVWNENPKQAPDVEALLLSILELSGINFDQEIGYPELLWVSSVSPGK
jgi:hypothetical protein